MTIASGLNVLAGIWLIIAPFVLGYGSGDPIWNDVIFGALIGLVALSRVAGLYRESWLSWLNVLFGAWIFASAFWLDSTATAGWNDVILGIIVILLAAWSASASAPAVVTTGRTRTGPADFGRGTRRGPAAVERTPEGRLREEEEVRRPPEGPGPVGGV